MSKSQPYSAAAAYPCGWLHVSGSPYDVINNLTLYRQLYEEKTTGKHKRNSRAQKISTPGFLVKRETNNMINRSSERMEEAVTS